MVFHPSWLVDASEVVTDIADLTCTREENVVLVGGEDFDRGIVDFGLCVARVCLLGGG